ncbi:hypothetical protein Cassandra_0212 [Pseudomonas phage Cassandra]|nr:hypothetical protein Cassandra_0212 [Pseudomonas phage Cassandra]
MANLISTIVAIFPYLYSISRIFEFGNYIEMFVHNCDLV